MPQVKAVIGADARQFNKAMKDASKQISAFSNVARNLSNMFAGAFAAGSLVEFGEEMNRLAIEISSTEKKAAIVFGEFAVDVKAMADESSTALGLTNNEFLKAASSAADLLVPIGFTRREASKMSTDLIKLSGALSAWTSGQYDSTQVSEILTKALLGEREQLKSLGIKISEADVAARLADEGQSRLTGTALEQAKALATLNLIYEKSTDAQTSFATGANDLITQQNQIAAGFGTIKEIIAEKFTPAIAAATAFVVKLLQKLWKVYNSGPSKVDVKRDAYKAANEETKQKLKDEIDQEVKAKVDEIEALKSRYGLSGELRNKGGFVLGKQGQEINSAVDKIKSLRGQVDVLSQTLRDYKSIDEEIAVAAEGNNEIKKTESGIITELEAKIKSLTESKAEANSLDEIRRINDRVEALQAEKKIYEELTNTINRMPAKKGMSMSEVMGTLQGRVDAKNQIASDKRMQQRDVPSPAEMSPALAPGYSEQMQAGWAAWGEEMTRVRDISNDVNSAISAGMANLAGFVGESIGALISGTGDMGDVFEGLLGLVADFMAALGKSLIESGTAAIAFQKLYLAPWAAIAAGVSLIALAGVTRGLLQKGPAGGGGEGVRKFADGGVIFGPTFGLMGEYAGASRNPEVVSPLSTLKGLIGGNDQEVTVYGALRGDDLLISNNRTVYRHSRVKG